MRCAVLVVLVLELAGAMGGRPPARQAQPSAASTPAQRAYEKGNALFKEKRLRESFAALEEALAADPNHVPALTLKARIAIAAGLFDVARESLQRAIAADPTSGYARFLLGYEYYLLNDWDHALSELRTAQKLNPRDARISVYLGMTYESLGDTQNAISSYQEAIRQEEVAGAVELNTVLAYSQFLLLQGRLSDCTQVLNKALQLYPGSRDVHYALGRLLLERGDPRGAAKEGEKALLLPSQDVGDLQIRYLLVRAYEAAGDDRLAAKHADTIKAAETPKPAQ